MMVNKDGVIEEKSQAGFLNADDVCLMVVMSSTCKPFLTILADALKNMV